MPTSARALSVYEAVRERFQGRNTHERSEHSTEGTILAFDHGEPVVHQPLPFLRCFP